VWIDQAAKELGASVKWLPFELHPDTPLEGAPKPFTDEQWPAIRARLSAMAERVGLPINPPRMNANSRLALETGELIRAKSGDDASARFHHAVSRAFFVDSEDIADFNVIARIAAAFGIKKADLQHSSAHRQYAKAIDDSMRAAQIAGVSGVPAFGWPAGRATSGMMEPESIVAILKRTKPMG
jgi:predicted DsbA family dithiol-disulfide isomerase